MIEKIRSEAKDFEEEDLRRTFNFHKHLKNELNSNYF